MGRWSGEFALPPVLPWGASWGGGSTATNRLSNSSCRSCLRELFGHIRRLPTKVGCTGPLTSDGVRGPILSALPCSERAVRSRAQAVARMSRTYWDRVLPADAACWSSAFRVERGTRTWRSVMVSSYRLGRPRTWWTRGPSQEPSSYSAALASSGGTEEGVDLVLAHLAGGVGGHRVLLRTALISAVVFLVGGVMAW